MKTVTVTLSNDLSKKAEAKDLLLEDSLVILITEAVEKDVISPKK